MLFLRSRNIVLSSYRNNDLENDIAGGSYIYIFIYIFIYIGFPYLGYPSSNQTCPRKIDSYGLEQWRKEKCRLTQDMSSVADCTLLHLSEFSTVDIAYSKFHFYRQIITKYRLAFCFRHLLGVAITDAFRIEATQTRRSCVTSLEMLTRSIMCSRRLVVQRMGSVLTWAWSEFTALWIDAVHARRTFARFSPNPPSFVRSQRLAPPLEHWFIKTTQFVVSLLALKDILRIIPKDVWLNVQLLTEKFCLKWPHCNSP